MGEYTDGRGRVWVVGGRVGVYGVARTGVGVNGADGRQDVNAPIERIARWPLRSAITG